MSAPPSVGSQEIINLKISNIQCFDHPNNKIIGICNDNNCKIKNKYICVDCMFESHSGHKGIKLNLLEDYCINKINSIKSKNEFINSEYLKFEKNLRIKIDAIKNKINNILESFYEINLRKINNNKFIAPEPIINEIKKNYPPTSKNQLNQLLAMLLKLYNSNNNKEKENKIYESKIEEIFKNYEEQIQVKINSLEKYLNEFIDNDSDINNRFQWSTKTYGIYGFYYKLEEDNTKAIKILKGGTMTICRAKNHLEKGNKYKMEYFINYINGDFDVGFGDDKIGPTCWLRSLHGYGITSKGIYINGDNVNSSIKLVNAKKITFIVDLKNFKSEIFIDDQKRYDFNINQDFIYYPMIAIREVNNSVKLKITEIN